MNRIASNLVIGGLVLALLAGTAVAGDWTFWRGPSWDGVAEADGLVSTWTVDGENQVWRADFIGRSTPVVIGDRVCVIGRYGVKETIEQLERVACFDAADGSIVWDDRYPVYHTTVAFNRAGWASLAADPETGAVYSHGAAGQLHAYAPDGSILWSHFLPEYNGRLSGYGGRTQTPLVDGDLLILSFVSSGWGDQAAPRHRTFAFDKHNGDLVWSATPGNFPKDMNTQGGPVVATVEGRKMLISGNADGWVYALDYANGETIWKFHLSKRGINVTPVVRGKVVYFSHSEENIDTPDQGRIVAIDASGSGDITATGAVWQLNALQAGFPSPMIHGDDLFIVDNSANLHRFDAGTGEEEAEFSIGTVGKGSAVWADGKIWVGEVNGRFHILESGDDGIRALSSNEIKMPDGRYAEIYGSPAVAGNRVFFATENGLFAIGNPKAKFKAAKPAKPAKAKPAKGDPYAIHVVPGESLLAPGEALDLAVRAVDAAGVVMKSPKVSWSLDGLAGKVTNGTFTPDPEAGSQAGRVVATAGDKTAGARVRVIAGMPWDETFDGFPADATPGWWLSAKGKFKVTEREGEQVVVQPPRAKGLQRSFTYIGPDDWSDYTVQADVLGTPYKRRRPDLGIINAGYTLDLQGNSQKLQIRSWAAEMRMAQDVPFAWDLETWYTLKLEVRVRDGKAIVRGKVWKRDDPEPEDWTLTAEDPFPVTAGSPGLIGYAPSEVYYDNLKVWKNQ